MRKILIGVILALMLVACKSKPIGGDIAVIDRSTGGPGGTGSGVPTQSTGTGGGSTITGSGLGSGQGATSYGGNAREGILAQRIIYFDLDQDTVRADFVNIVQAHARFMAENPGRSIRLEGHADERGSREYNMALGQRRAEAVRRSSSALGVNAGRMETISFGEDKPKANGSDEASFAQNRRVEIVYDGE